ncbi:MAG TPA: hypothetical protein VF658_02095 [Pyrinomonadaceae bacterium]|jgi:hypothetical protein
MPNFTDDPVISRTNNAANAIEGESKDGRGLVGRSNTNYGIRGHSIKSAGIRGSSEDGRGVEGWTETSEGVVGISETGHGVWGQTEGTGHGVVGTSKSGVGVFGKGGRLAGLFEGSVEITAFLKVGGVSFLVLTDRVKRLENFISHFQEVQRVYERLKTLEEKVAALESAH